jgi:hypothetical protein
MNHPPQQRSYLLRLCQSTNRNALKASLIDVHDPANKLHFATLEDMYFYLKETIAPALASDGAAQGHPDDEVPASSSAPSAPRPRE